MSVQSPDEGANWVDVTRVDPGLRPALPRNAHVRRRALQESLNVRHIGVGLHDMVSRQQAVTVGRLGSLHGSRARRQLLEDSRVPILIADIITLKNHPILKVSSKIPFKNSDPFSTMMPKR